MTGDGRRRAESGQVSDPLFAPARPPSGGPWASVLGPPHSAPLHVPPSRVPQDPPGGCRSHWSRAMWTLVRPWRANHDALLPPFTHFQLFVARPPGPAGPGTPLTACLMPAGGGGRRAACERMCARRAGTLPERSRGRGFVERRKPRSRVFSRDRRLPAHEHFAARHRDHHRQRRMDGRAVAFGAGALDGFITFGAVGSSPARLGALHFDACEASRTYLSSQSIVSASTCSALSRAA